MPDTQFYTKEAARAKATAILATYATSKLHLCKAPFSPTVNSTKAELVAAECDFDGYTAGGIAITAFSGPLDFPGGGAVLTSPLKTITYNTPSDPPVGNDVSGWWIENTGGDVILVGKYDPVRPMQSVGDGIQWIGQDVEGVNAGVSNPG